MTSRRSAGLATICAVLMLTSCGRGPMASNPTSPSTSTSALVPSPDSPSPTTAATPGGSSPSDASSRTASAAESPSPVNGVVPPARILCPSPPAAGQRLALVNLPGSGAVALVRDVTDLPHPMTRCTIYGGNYFRFKDATHVSYIVYQNSSLGSPGAMYLADLQTRATSLVRSFSYGGYASWVYSWSPDGQGLTYLSSDASSVKWHLQTPAGDRVLSDLGPVVPRGVNLDVDDAMVGFSADGQYVAVVETFTRSINPPFQIVQAADGKLVYSRTDGTMAAWLGSSAKLYFRTTTGLLIWSPGGEPQTRATILQWVHPWASADGGRIVFTVVDPTGNHRVSALNTIDTSIGPLVQGARVGAAFVTPTLVWAAEEKECSSNPCGLGGPPPSGNTYIYDFGTQSETRSILTAFFDSWPHVAGQS